MIRATTSTTPTVPIVVLPKIADKPQTFLIAAMPAMRHPRITIFAKRSPAARRIASVYDLLAPGDLGVPSAYRRLS